MSLVVKGTKQHKCTPLMANYGLHAIYCQFLLWAKTYNFSGGEWVATMGTSEWYEIDPASIRVVCFATI